MLWNFGLTLRIVLILAVMLARSKDAEARFFVWTALVIFLICCVVIFTPWEWDNMKLMMWSWLVIAPYIWTNLIAGLQLPARAALWFVLFFREPSRSPADWTPAMATPLPDDRSWTPGSTPLRTFRRKPVLPARRTTITPSFFSDGKWPAGTRGTSGVMGLNSARNSRS